MEITSIYNISLEDALKQKEIFDNQLKRVREDIIRKLPDEYWLKLWKNQYLDCVYFIISLKINDEPYIYIKGGGNDYSQINAENIDNMFSKIIDKIEMSILSEIIYEYNEYKRPEEIDDNLFKLYIEEIQDSLIINKTDYNNDDIYYSNINYEYIADILYKVYKNNTEEINKALYKDLIKYINLKEYEDFIKSS